MKNIKFTVIGTFIVLMFSIFMVTSCSNDESAGGPPQIISVSLSMLADDIPSDLTPTTVGYADNMYIIHGSGLKNTQKIYFNDVDTYFNPTLVTDTDIFVTIDRKTPYQNASNELKIVTLDGTVVYDFIVAPPAPSLDWFNPVNASEGDIITIHGSYFLDPIVTVGDQEVAPISSTLTDITFQVPAGADKKLIKVTTISGSDESDYAVGTALFDDVEYNGFDFPSWNNHTYESDGTAEQGLIYIKKTTGAWDNFQGNWSWDDQIADYAGIRIAIKAEKPGTIKFIFNGDWSERNLLTVTTGWQTYYIPWSELGNADHVQNISFQNFTKNAAGDGEANTFSIDNIGYYLE